MFVLPEDQAILAASGKIKIESTASVVYRCPKRLNKFIPGTLAMQTWRCTHCVRRDRIGVHNGRCVYNCKPEFDSMMAKEVTVARQSRDNRAELYTARILRYQTVAMGRLGISFRKMASNAMFEMSRGLVQIGMDLQAKAPDGTRYVADDFVRKYKRNVYQEELIRASEAELSHLCTEYNRLRFANLKIDAGKVLKSHLTHAVIDGPAVTFGPWICPAAENSGWNTIQYKNYLNSLLDDIHQKAPNLVICSIIHDNLPAQSNAVESVIRERQAKTIDVPCFNHMLQLVFTAILESFASRWSMGKSMF